jgi:exopolysaccharide biosynthesis polyprenyl glycosylphosphotransferase
VTRQDAYGSAHSASAALEQVETPPGAPPLLKLIGCTGRFWRDALLRRLLVTADVAALLVVAGVLAAWGTTRDAEALLFFIPAWLVLAKLFGLYDRDHRSLRHLTIDDFPTLALWSLAGSAAMTLILITVSEPEFMADDLALLWVLTTTVALAFRGIARSVFRRIAPRERAVIVGDGPLADAARRKLRLFPDIHVQLVGQIGDLNNFPDLITARHADRVVLATETLREEDIAELLLACRASETKLSVVPPARGMFGTAAHLEHIGEMPMLDYNTWDVSRSTLVIKRALDVAVALPAVVLLSPVFALIALAIKLDSRGPVFFGQTRAGRDGMPFRMFKFRTMIADAEEHLGHLVRLEELPEPMFKLRRDPRVTRVGRFLRRSSLDELPQLLNILGGSMSLVGPRPEQVELVERYEDEHRFRLSVKPGLTGPMQVYGRGELSFNERLAVERDYIENLSLGRDLRILGMTVAVVIRGRGAF